MPDAAERFERMATWLDAACDGKTATRIDTHTAAIFLIGDRALKLRRPVDYGWLDYSTREKRLAAARRETAQNARTAPGLGLGIVGLIEAGNGFRLTSPGEALSDGAEPLTAMHRFADDVLFERMAEEGRLSLPLMRRTGQAVAAMHRTASPRPGPGHLPSLAHGEDRQLAALKSILSSGSDRLLQKFAVTHERLAPALQHRRAKRCHGDLHLGNIVLWNGTPAPFDSIDFNDSYSDIDPLYDLAFLLMDLDRRNCPELASAVLNAWAEALSASPGADVETAYGGLALLDFYKALRAAIRAKVGALAIEAGAGNAEEAKRKVRGYVDLALGYLEKRAEPRLIAVGGFSGTGKTTLSRQIAAQPGAILLRSDTVRKGLHGAAETERLPSASYTQASSDRVYGELLFRAALVLQSGCPVIIDAAHLRARERDATADLARRLGVRFDGLWLAAPPEVLAGRLDARQGDASDADRGVLEMQLARDPGMIDWHRISTASGRDATATLASTMLGL